MSRRRNREKMPTSLSLLIASIYPVLFQDDFLQWMRSLPVFLSSVAMCRWKCIVSLKRDQLYYHWDTRLVWADLSDFVGRVSQEVICFLTETILLEARPLIFLLVSISLSYRVCCEREMSIFRRSFVVMTILDNSSRLCGNIWACWTESWTSHIGVRSHSSELSTVTPGSLFVVLAVKISFGETYLAGYVVGMALLIL